MTESEPTDSGRHHRDRAVGSRHAGEGTTVEHVLTRNSLRAVNRRARTVARVEGINPPSPNELGGRPRRYQRAGPVEPGRPWTVLWGVDFDAAPGPIVRRTRTAPVVTVFRTLPVRRFTWWPRDDDQAAGVVVVSDAAPSPPLAMADTLSTAFVLSWLLNLAASPAHASAGLADASPFSVIDDTLCVAGVPLAATREWDPSLTRSLNALPDVAHCAAGLLYASGTGWDLVPVELLPDTAVQGALRQSGLTDADIGRLDPGTARHVVGLTRLLCEHLAWSDTGAWWRTGRPAPLDLAAATDRSGAEAAVAAFLRRPPTTPVATRGPQP